MGAADRVARQAQDRQAEAGHRAREGLAGLDQIALDDVVDEADSLGLVGLDGAPGQDQFGGARLADEARQTLGSAISRNEAELDLGKAELGRGRGETKGAGERQFEPAAKGVAVDQRNRRQRQLVELGQDRLAERRAGALLDEGAAHQLLDVGAGRKGAVAGAGDQDGARIAVGDRVELPAQIVQQAEAEGVERLRPVEGDQRQLVDAAHVDRHASALLGPVAGRAGPAHRHRPDAARPRPFDELALQDLAARGQRVGGHRDEILGHVVARQPGSVQMRQQFLRLGAGALVKNDRQADLFAEPAIGDGERRDAGHRRVPHRQILDPRRIDVVAAADDQILLAADDFEAALVVEPAEIAAT